jgi:hypothetical protein
MAGSFPAITHLMQAVPTRPLGTMRARILARLTLQQWCGSIRRMIVPAIGRLAIKAFDSASAI